MSTLEDLAERVERLVLRHEELERTNAILRKELEGTTTERDNLRSRLTAARARIDTLLERLPSSAHDGVSESSHDAHNKAGGHDEAN